MLTLFQSIRRIFFIEGNNFYVRIIKLIINLLSETKKLLV